MCFSTEASFTASVLLGLGGIATLRNANSSLQFLFAAIPIIFALQQFSEGLIWLHIRDQVGSQQLFLNAQRSFLTLAFLIWPVWIPLSLALWENIPKRRNLLLFFLALGCTLTGIFFINGIHQEVKVQVVNHSLQYTGHMPNEPLLTRLYGLIVLLPIFISSVKNMWLFGVLVTIAYIAADYFYSATFVSVWCFFSAIVSLSIYKILRDNRYQLAKDFKEKS